MSESYLWQLQEDYYAEQSLNAWERVPFYTTNRMNFVAYNAELINAFMLDYADCFDYDEPLYILELGGGSGCFAYRFLNELLSSKGDFDKLKNLQLRYVLSDFAQSNISAHIKNPRLQSLIESGVLDVSVFRPDQTTSLSLEISGQKVTSGQMRNPLIVLANYLFDTIKHDAFRVDSGRLEEVKFSLSRDHEVDSVSEQLTIQNVKMSESYHEIALPYYKDGHLDSILEYYKDNLKDASIIFPIGAFRSIANLCALSNDRLFLIANDKGFAQLDSRQIVGLRTQSFAEHGAFSFDVNFDAIARYLNNRGGSALIDSGDHSSLGFLVGTTMNCSYPLTSHLFRHSTQKLDQCNASYNIEEVLFAGCEAGKEFDRPALTVFKSIVQCSNYDPFIFDGAFARLFERLLPELENLDAEREREFKLLVRRVANNIFNVANSYEDLVAILEFCMQAGFYQECLDIATQSMTCLGTVRQSYDFAALACEHLERKKDAYNYFKQALDLVPDHVWAKEGMERNSVS